MKTVIRAVLGAMIVCAATLSGGAAWAGTHAPHATKASTKADGATGPDIAAYALTFVGRYPYVYGGSSPATGFDCSGLSQYVYGSFGLAIPRTAQEQYWFFHREARRNAQPGDLVFYHSGGRHGPVFHVAVYEGNGYVVAAADQAEGIVYQPIWWRPVTFGSITHQGYWMR